VPAGWSCRRPRATSPALVTLAATLALLAHARGGSRGLDAPGAGLAALATLPLLARRRSLLSVFALTTAASAALNGLGYPLGPPFGPTVTLFFVATDERTRDRLRETAAVVLALFALHVGMTAVGDSGFPTSPILFGVVVWDGAWVVGDQLPSGGSGSATSSSEHARPSESSSASAASRPRRSGRGSRATSTTRRRTRST